MAPRPMRMPALLLCLCCHAAALAQAETPPAPAPPVLRTQAQWQALVAAKQPTPLDALTPYGKRRLVASLSWGRRGIGGFTVAPLVRELDREQLAAVLHFLGADEYLAVLGKDLTGQPLRMPAPSEDVERRLEGLERFAQEDAARREDGRASSTRLDGSAVLAHYEAAFGARMRPAALARQAAGDLLPLFDAASSAAQDNPDSRALADLMAVHAEIRARGLDTRRTLDGAVLDALLAARRFTEARAFAAARPSLAGRAVPQVQDALGPDFKGRSVLAYDPAANTITRQALPPPKGRELVMVIDGGCHFSREALAAIRDDADLLARLRAANLVLVTPPRVALDLEFVAAWNEANPALPIRMPFDAREWRAVDVSGVPAFILLKDGKPLGQRLSGWPEGGNAAALLRLLGAAGR